MHCISCKEDKPEDQFNFRNKAKGVRQRYCKPCDSKIRKSAYNNHKTKTVAKVQERNRLLHADFKELKASLFCEVCGEDAPECLDFHHVDPTQKDAAVSTLIHYGRKKLQEEIEKCKVLCSNCHRKVHSGRIML